MYLSHVKLNGFRNLSTTIEVSHPLSLIVGENNVGKTNVIDAIRLALLCETGQADNRWIKPEDFAHEGTGTPVVDAFTIELLFRGLDDVDQGRLHTVRAPASGADAAILGAHGVLEGAGSRPALYTMGGEDLAVEADIYARRCVQYTYLPALRDAATDLTPGSTNRLKNLLSTVIKGEDKRAELVDVMVEANKNLKALGGVGSSEELIRARFNRILGPTFAQALELAFADPRFDRIVGGVRALVGSGKPLEVRDNGLGYNNLLYISVLLAALAEAEDVRLHLILVEEPEAHLHPQFQQLLSNYLKEAGAQASVQIVATTHSPNLSSGADVEAITVLTKGAEGKVLGRRVADIGLAADELLHLTRFLDVTKAALFFARGLILVEGISEQLLLPMFAASLDRDLDKLGVTVINVGGVAFRPFARLFGAAALPVKCSIVSDSDPPNVDQDELSEGDPVLSSTAARTQSLRNEFVDVFLSNKTFEHDLIAAGNWEVPLEALKAIRPRIADKLAKKHAGTVEWTKRADDFLIAVKDHKGRFAQSLASLMSDKTKKVIVPEYMTKALKWLSLAPLKNEESSDPEPSA